MIYYLPSWNGDFRLVPDGDGACKLVMEKPTPAEIAICQVFLTAAYKRGWCGEWQVGSGSIDVSTFAIKADVATAGKVLLKLMKPKAQTLTAVKFADGRIETAHGADSKEVAALLDKAQRADAAGKRSKTDADAVSVAKSGNLSLPASPPLVVPDLPTLPASPEIKAVSVARPTPSCPNCIPDSVGPAREVLLSFLDEEQHGQWSRHRAVIVRGGLSGHRYRIAHRNTPTAVAQTKICYDLDDRAILHFHDWSVPPEEEVLAAVLILTHAEPWLRNEATALGVAYNAPPPPLPVGGVQSIYAVGDALRGRMRMRYKNPFGDGRDGLADTAFTRALGRFARGFLP